MFSKKHYINWISLSLIFIINQIFLIKHLSKDTDYYIVGFILYSLFFVSLIIINKFIAIRSSIEDKKYYYISAIIFLLLLTVLLYAMPESANQNRINNIKDWLQNFQDGIYPYISSEKFSPFPFLFFLVSPFYFMGLLELLPVVGIGIILFLAIFYSSNRKELLLRSSLIVLSLPFYYEIFARSDLTFNIGILIILIFLTYKFVDPGKTNSLFFLYGIIWGLALATRMISFVVLFLFLMFHFRRNLFNLYTFGSLSILIFSLVNLPFFLWYPELFILDGPFAVQSSYLPFFSIILFVILMVYAGWIIADLRELFFAVGMIIFLFTLSSFLIEVWNYGIYNALFKSYFDIVYFIFALPFFILSIKDFQIDKFLGKVLD